MGRLLWLVVLASTAQVGQALMVSAPDSLVGNQGLNGNCAYQWGIGINLDPGQQITSATITFNNVALTGGSSSRGGYLYTDILNLNNSGVTTVASGTKIGDNFISQVSSGQLCSSDLRSLGAKYFSSVGNPMSWSYTLTSAQLAKLNSYLVDGIFDIGLDTDGNFSVGSITFSYTITGGQDRQGPAIVPDGGNTLVLIALGLLGLMGAQMFMSQSKQHYQSRPVWMRTWLRRSQ